MNRYCVRSLSCMLTVLLAAFVVVGCDSKSESGGGAPAAKSAANVLGTYENANEKMTIVLKAENKAALIDEGKSTDLKWEMDGAEKVVLHGMDGVSLVFTINSEGHLSDGMGGVFRRK